MSGAITLDGRTAEQWRNDTGTPSPDSGVGDKTADATAAAANSATLPTTTQQQRPFAPETMYTTSPWVPKLMRGYIQRFDTVASAPSGYRWNFLYNPNEINVAYTLNPNARGADNQSAGANAGGYGGPSSIDFTFNLVIDRSFEVAYHGDPDGARHDVECLELLLGVSQVTPYLTSMAVMKIVLGTKMTFYGWITGASVQYLYFNQDMVPMRAQISVGARVYPIPPSANVQESLALPRASSGLRKRR